MSGLHTKPLANRAELVGRASEAGKAEVEDATCC